MPQRRELAKVAVALHVHGQQHHRQAVIPSEPRNLSGFFSPLVYPELRGATRHPLTLSGVEGPLDIQRYADNRLNLLVLRLFVKRHGRVHAIGVRQRDGRHVLLDCGGDDLVRGSNAPQERVVAVTMQMDEHEAPEGKRHPACGHTCYSESSRGQERATSTTANDKTVTPYIKAL